MGTRSGRSRRTVARSLSFAAVLLLVIRPHAFASVHREPPGWQPPGRYASLGYGPRYVVIMVLDGGLPSYFKLAQFPHIAALIRHGVTYYRAWDGMLETETPTGHATLGTGALPGRHGIISFGWVNDNNVHLQPTNPIPIQQGQMEQVLRRSGTQSIASLLKQQDPTARVVVTSGHKDYAVDAVGGWAADYLMYYTVMPNQMWAPQAIPRHVPPRPVMASPGLQVFAPHLYTGLQDSLAVQLALSAFRQIHQRVTIINLPEFDWPLGHLQGGGADTYHAWRLMSQLDQDLAEIKWEYSQAHLLGQTLFVLTADHGMLTLNHTVSHVAIQNAVHEAGTSLEEYDFHTAGYLWIRDRSRAARVAAKILALHDPRIRAVYYRKPGAYTYALAPDQGRPISAGLDHAYQYLLGTLAGPSAPAVAIFLTENTSILGRNQTSWHGDHGGPSWNAEHIPLIISGPGMRENVHSGYPATLYDVAPTVLSLLGVTPRGMDGVELADGMILPSQSAEDQQAARGALLQPVVDALRAQSRQDGP